MPTAARAKAYERFNVIRGQGNVGVARAGNLGARAPGGLGHGADAAPRHLLFLNPDAVLAPNAVRALTAAGEGRARPWIAGGRILDLEDREQRGGRRRAPNLARALGALIGGAADRMHLEGAPAPDEPVPVDAVSGACLLMRADDFAAILGFDEAYFLHVEDLDICRRAQSAGGEVLYVPAAVARHAGGTSDAPKLFVEWCKGRGLARYFVRFADGPAERVLAVAAGPLVVAAAVARGAVRRRAR
jgi:GT2 family glycosyltransferase